MFPLPNCKWQGVLPLSRQPLSKEESFIILNENTVYSMGVCVCVCVCGGGGGGGGAGADSRTKKIGWKKKELKENKVWSFNTLHRLFDELATSEFEKENLIFVLHLLPSIVGNVKAAPWQLIVKWWFGQS